MNEEEREAIKILISRHRREYEEIIKDLELEISKYGGIRR